LHVWHPNSGYFIGLAGDKADQFIRQNISDNMKNKINTRSSDEIVRWLIAEKRLQASEEALSKRKDYVPFTNCVVRYNDLTIHRHSPNYYFTSIINSEYPMDYEPNG